MYRICPTKVSTGTRDFGVSKGNRLVEKVTEHPVEPVVIPSSKVAAAYDENNRVLEINRDNS